MQKKYLVNFNTHLWLKTSSEQEIENFLDLIKKNLQKNLQDTRLIVKVNCFLVYQQ